MDSKLKVPKVSHYSSTPDFQKKVENVLKSPENYKIMDSCTNSQYNERFKNMGNYWTVVNDANLPNHSAEQIFESDKSESPQVHNSALFKIEKIMRNFTHEITKVSAPKDNPVKSFKCSPKIGCKRIQKQEMKQTLINNGDIAPSYTKPIKHEQNMEADIVNVQIQKPIVIKFQEQINLFDKVLNSYNQIKKVNLSQDQQSQQFSKNNDIQPVMKQKSAFKPYVQFKLPSLKNSTLLLDQRFQNNPTRKFHDPQKMLQ